MNKTTFILATTVALFSASSFAVTEKQQKQFDRNDTNNDGYMQASEQEAASLKYFTKKGLTGEALTKKVEMNVKGVLKRDSNNDGKVDVKEYFAPNKNKNKNKNKEK